MGSRLKLHWSLAPQKKHPETIVLVHNMLGSYKSVQRHQRWLNQLGYNTVSFDLPLASRTFSSLVSIRTFLGLFGFFQVWRDQISDACDLVQGKKIIFSFSGPSLSAILAASKRPVSYTHLTLPTTPYV